MAKTKVAPKKTCEKCNRSLTIDRNFYLCDNSPLFPSKRFHICNKCLNEMFEEDEDLEVTMMALHAMNKPFFRDDLEASSSVGAYIRKFTTLPNLMGYDWKSSDFTKIEESKAVQKRIKNDISKDSISETTETNNQDKEDVLKMLGYDPFEHEPLEDRGRMYSALINYLDESTLEDGFKLQAVVEIVSGFSQVEKINAAITGVTKNVEQMSRNSGGVKTLIDAKKNIIASLTSLAKENGISVKHSLQKNKGAGTLSGIMKELSEKDVEDAQLNLYDIDTSAGMKQVADLSNESIIKQLQFDENDYSEMLIEQRQIIDDLSEKHGKLEEENRLLKKEMLKKDGD